MRMLSKILTVTAVLSWTAVTAVAESPSTLRGYGDHLAGEGAALDYPRDLGGDPLAADPNDVIENVLRGYNYLVEWGPAGAVAIRVSGRNGDGATAVAGGGPAAPSLPLLRYEAVGNIPKELGALPSGSVSLIVLPKKEMLAMKFGETGSLDLPIGEWKVVHDNRVAHSNGDVTWIAQSREYGVGYRAIITFGKKDVVGTINTPDGEYIVKTVKGKTYLLDVKNSGLKEPELTLPEVIVLPNGKVVSPSGALRAAEPLPSISLASPYYGKAGSSETVSWTSANLDSSLSMTLSFSKNGGATFSKAVKTTLGNMSTVWTPKSATKNGVLRACVSPSGAMPVCGYANVYIVGKKSTFTAPETEYDPPTAPTWIAGTGKKANLVNLTINPATDNVRVMGYNLYKDGKFYRAVTTTGFNSAMKKNSTVSFSFEAYDSSGNKSPRSLEMVISSPLDIPASDAIAPSMPMRLSVSLPKATATKLSWSKPVENKALAGYSIFRNGEYYARAKGTAFTDRNIVPNGYYAYSIEAVDKAGNRSPASETVAIGTPPVIDTEAPTIPTNLAGTATGATTVSLTCTASTDNVGVAGYQVFRNGTQIGTSGNCSYSDTGLAQSTSYVYSVKAYDAAGNASAESASVTVTTPKATDSTPPSVPTGLAGTASGTTSISLSWAASTDNVAVSEYNVYRGGAKVGTAAGTAFEDTGLSVSTSYAYAVSAVDTSGNESAKSAGITVATQAGNCDVYPPYPHDGDFSATTINFNGRMAVSLVWIPGKDYTLLVPPECISGIAGYNIYRDGVKIATVPGSSYVDNDPNLTPYKSYVWELESFDHAGNVSWKSPLPYMPLPIHLPGPHTIDLMVYLNQDVTATRLNQMIATANQAYLDSEIDFQLRLVHTETVDYPTTTTSFNALGDLQQSVGVFADMVPLRNQYGADLVTFVRQIYLEQGVCGIAFINGANQTQMKPSDGLSVVSTDLLGDTHGGAFCPDYALPHELGHNMGNIHNVEVDPNSVGVLPYSRGFAIRQNDPTGVGSVMSYHENHVNLFSSPNLTVKDKNGVSFALGIPDVADVSRSMNEIGYLVEGFMPKTVP